MHLFGLADTGTLEVFPRIAILRPRPPYCKSFFRSPQLQILFWRFILSSIYIGGGSPLGIEAPTFHLAAALASNVNTLVENMGLE